MSDDTNALNIVERIAERLRQANAKTAADVVQPPPPIRTIAEDASPVAPDRTDQSLLPLQSGPDTVREASTLSNVAVPQNMITIDEDQMARKGYIIPGAVKTLLSDEFRIIKRPLLRKAIGPDAVRNGNVIMVTSARPGEGKTFTAINLAFSMATERGLNVMLIDSDIYTHSVLNTFGVTAERGLVDLLLDETLSFSDVLLKTSIPNLTILPAGINHPQATELLSSQRMVALTQDIAPRYPDRIIVIDAPPLLSSTEPSVLASHVGQVVMVVEYNVTGWRLVERSLAMIRNCEEINFVLNKVEPFGRGDRFGSRSRYTQQYFVR